MNWPKAVFGVFWQERPVKPELGVPLHARVAVALALDDVEVEVELVVAESVFEVLEEVVVVVTVVA